MDDQQIKALSLQHKIKERFLRYAAIDSQSAENEEIIPSTPGQWILAKQLVQELKALGLSEITLNTHGVVQAHLPAHLPDSQRQVPSIGWVCHLDTVDIGLSPQVHPKLISRYQGQDICQNETEQIYLTVKDHPELLAYIGEDILVSDGTSVLGADNKAAIANIMTAIEILQTNRELEHGPIYLAFVPDEEVGLRGAKVIDYDRFPVDYAYTIDCCALGEVVYETFHAGSATLEITGITAHPMSAKDRLVNPILVATDFINLLDREKTPEHTEGREGYIWITDIHSDVLRCTITLNIRDHNKDGYEQKKEFLRTAFNHIKSLHPKARLQLHIADIYGNIADTITPDNKNCINHLYHALEELNIPAKTIAMRGGTDGSYISTKGILTPNYFTGAHNFHSPAEFLPLGAAEKSCLVTLKLIELAVKESTKNTKPF